MSKIEKTEEMFCYQCEQNISSVFSILLIFYSPLAVSLIFSNFLFLWLEYTIIKIIILLYFQQIQGVYLWKKIII